MKEALKHLSDKHPTLKSELEKLLLRGSVEKAMQSFADEQNKKEKQRHALEELTQTSTIDELVEKVKKLEGENKELKQQLEDAKRKVSDTLNWVKSELKQEEHSKLSKTMSPYRTDKIKFLRRTINHLNQEG